MLHLLILFATAATAQFQGTWHLNGAKGKNLGAMASMEETQTIEQTAERLTIHDRATMMGQTVNHDVVFDLTGAPATNEDAMGNRATTTSHWDGPRLLTTWKTAGAIAGSTTERIEKRYLDDGEMVVESVRGNRPAVVMVYERR